MPRPLVFTGNANPDLAHRIAALSRDSVAPARVQSFSDGEVSVEIEANVRGQDAFIIQPTCKPANDNLMELLVIADALKRSAAGRIVAVIPYYGYSRQDKRARSTRVPITAKLVANMIAEAGIDHVLTVDLHSDQLQGFFDVPVDNVYGSYSLMDYIKKHFVPTMKAPLVVSPDVGGVVRARAVANELGTDLAIIDKRRPRANESEVMNLIGDVTGMDCVIFDDMIDTAGTLCKAATALVDAGARSVIACATHAVFSDPAIENIQNSKLDAVVVTNTIPSTPKSQSCDKIHVVDIASLLHEAITRIHNEESVSVMFKT